MKILIATVLSFLLATIPCLTPCVALEAGKYLVIHPESANEYHCIEVVSEDGMCAWSFFDDINKHELNKKLIEFEEVIITDECCDQGVYLRTKGCPLTIYIDKEEVWHRGDGFKLIDELLQEQQQDENDRHN